MMNLDANKNYLLESAAEEMRWQWQYMHFLAFEYRLVYQMMVTRDSLQMDSMMAIHLVRVQVPQMDSMTVMRLSCLLAYLCSMERRMSMVIHLVRVQGTQMDSMMVMHLVRVQVPQMDSMMVMHLVRRLVDLQCTLKYIVQEMSVLSLSMTV
jgi:hypothetical protein